MLPSILDTDDGIFTDVSELHPSNAQLPILVTDDGIFTEVSELQL